MTLFAAWNVLVLMIGAVDLASTLQNRHEDLGILMLTKQNGVDEVTITRKPASWMQSAGSLGSEPQNFGISRKLRQSDDMEIINEQMVGNDTRTPIQQTLRYPWRAIGHLETRRPGLGWEQDSGRCSGALVGTRHVLTAAHCLWDIKTNSWFKDFRFIPGRAGSEKPYGEIGWTNAYIPVGWDNKVVGHDKFDYGLLELSEDIGERVGYFSYGYNCSEIAFRLNIAGYPGDIREGTFMFYTYCESIYLDACLSKGQSDLYRHKCDTAPGMSGGPMWVLNPSTQIREIRGIHKGATGSSNLGVYVSESLFKFIQEKMSESNNAESDTQETRDVAIGEIPLSPAEEISPDEELYIDADVEVDTPDIERCYYIRACNTKFYWVFYMAISENFGLNQQNQY